MKYYVIVFVLLFSIASNAQSNVSGMGRYILGVTTPDSLNRIDFVEEDQSYVKGTLTLFCTHIRTFKSVRVTIADIVVTNLSLAFYDNTLFKLSCDYDDKLKEAFLLKYGKGILKPKHSFLLCANRKDDPMVIWGEFWQNNDMLAFVVHSQGYNTDCQKQEEIKLVISSQWVSALTSDCELKNTNPSTEEFAKIVNDQTPGTQKIERVRKTKKGR